MAKQRRTWVYSPGLDPRAKASDALKGEVERKANELVETALTPKHVQPPPKTPKFDSVGSTASHGAGRMVNA